MYTGTLVEVDERLCLLAGESFGSSFCTFVSHHSGEWDTSHRVPLRSFLSFVFSLHESISGLLLCLDFIDPIAGFSFRALWVVHSLFLSLFLSFSHSHCSLSYDVYTYFSRSHIYKAKKKNYYNLNCKRLHRIKSNAFFERTVQ